MNNYKTEPFHIKDLINEVYGAGYWELTNKREQSKEESTRFAKLVLIQDINKCRKFMGATICVDEAFYTYYEMDIYDLQMELVKMEDSAYYYARESGLLTQYKAK